MADLYPRQGYLLQRNSSSAAYKTSLHFTRYGGDQLEKISPFSNTLLLSYLINIGFLWVYLIGQGAVGPDENVVGDRLPEHLHLQHVRQNLLRFAVKI
jgi:hypothetical protein